MQSFKELKRDQWKNKNVFLVGGGPSLIPYRDKLGLLYQKGMVCCVNDSYKYCHFPNMIFSLDHVWIKNNLSKIPDMECEVVGAVDEGNPRVECKNLVYIKRSYRTGFNYSNRLSDDPGIITNGMNSGFGALNVAFLMGSRCVFLLGFDFKTMNGKAHFHAGYSWYQRHCEKLFPKWAKAFEDTVDQLKAAGVQVFNCSPDSLLTCFPHKPYEEVL